MTKYKRRSSHNAEADLGKKQAPTERRATAKMEDSSPERQRRIAERAYELHVARGYRHGHDLEDWLDAEQQLADVA